MGKLRIKFLGTSSGEAIPRESCQCPQCKSKDKKDKRLRSSILINNKILIDAGPDILKQLTNKSINNLDSVIITHEHTDHIGGLKHLLKVSRNLRIIRMRPGQHFKLLGVDFFAFKVPHSNIAPTIGLEIGERIVYIPDSSSFSTALKYLHEAQIAIIDGSVLDRSFGGHISIKDAVTTVKQIKNIKKIYFTHNGHTKKTHREMVKLVQNFGDKRFTLAFDRLKLTI